MKRKIIFGCDDNEDYLQFWNLQRLIWIKKGWMPKLYFIGSEEKYNTLEKEGAEVIRIEPIKGIHTAYMAQIYKLFSVILEEKNSIIYFCDMDTIIVNNFVFIDNKIEENELKISSLIFENQKGYTKKINKNYFMCMHNLSTVDTFKKIFYDINNTKDGLKDFLVRNYSPDYRLRGNGWNTDQNILSYYINKWKLKDGNKISFHSMYDSKEAWLYRLASTKNPNYNMKDSYNCKIINNNIIEYINNNKHIIFLHPYLGHLFGKNKDQCNKKIKEEIINPLIKDLT